jgi:hypothetical protein
VPETRLYTESHDRIDYVILIFLQCLHSLVPRDIRLLHHEFDVFCFQTRIVNFLTIIILFIFLFFTSINSLAFTVVMGVVMARVVVVTGTNRLGSSERMSGVGLSL